MPASLSQRDNEENISINGSPAEKPRNNMVMTLGCKNVRAAEAQLFITPFPGASLTKAMNQSVLLGGIVMDQA